MLYHDREFCRDGESAVLTVRCTRQHDLEQCKHRNETAKFIDDIGVIQSLGHCA